MTSCYFAKLFACLGSQPLARRARGDGDASTGLVSFAAGEVRGKLQARNAASQLEGAHLSEKFSSALVDKLSRGRRRGPVSTGCTCSATTSRPTPPAALQDLDATTLDVSTSQAAPAVPHSVAQEPTAQPRNLHGLRFQSCQGPPASNPCQEHDVSPNRIASHGCQDDAHAICCCGGGGSTQTKGDGAAPPESGAPACQTLPSADGLAQPRPLQLYDGTQGAKIGCADAGVTPSRHPQALKLPTDSASSSCIVQLTYSNADATAAAAASAAAGPVAAPAAASPSRQAGKQASPQNAQTSPTFAVRAVLHAPSRRPAAQGRLLLLQEPRQAHLQPLPAEPPLALPHPHLRPPHRPLQQQMETVLFSTLSVEMEHARAVLAAAAMDAAASEEQAETGVEAGEGPGSGPGLGSGVRVESQVDASQGRQRCPRVGRTALQRPQPRSARRHDAGSRDDFSRASAGGPQGGAAAVNMDLTRASTDLDLGLDFVDSGGDGGEGEGGGEDDLSGIGRRDGGGFPSDCWMEVADLGDIVVLDVQEWAEPGVVGGGRRGRNGGAPQAHGACGQHPHLQPPAQPQPYRCAGGAVPAEHPLCLSPAAQLSRGQLVDIAGEFPWPSQSNGFEGMEAVAAAWEDSPLGRSGGRYYPGARPAAAAAAASPLALGEGGCTWSADDRSAGGRLRPQPEGGFGLLTLLPTVSRYDTSEFARAGGMAAFASPARSLARHLASAQRGVAVGEAEERDRDPCRWAEDGEAWSAGGGGGGGGGFPCPVRDAGAEAGALEGAAAEAAEKVEAERASPGNPSTGSPIGSSCCGSIPCTATATATDGVAPSCTALVPAWAATSSCCMGGESVRSSGPASAAAGAAAAAAGSGGGGGSASVGSAEQLRRGLEALVKGLRVGGLRGSGGMLYPEAPCGAYPVMPPGSEPGRGCVSGSDTDPCGELCGLTLAAVDGFSGAGIAHFLATTAAGSPAAVKLTEVPLGLTPALDATFAMGLAAATAAAAGEAPAASCRRGRESVDAARVAAGAAGAQCCGALLALLPPPLLLHLGSDSTVPRVCQGKSSAEDAGGASLALGCQCNTTADMATATATPGAAAEAGAAMAAVVEARVACSSGCSAGEVELFRVLCQEVVQAATEIARLSLLRHPNIVQMCGWYCGVCVEHRQAEARNTANSGTASSSPSAISPRSPSHRGTLTLRPANDADCRAAAAERGPVGAAGGSGDHHGPPAALRSPVCIALVTDGNLGTLQQALARGVFGGRRPDWQAVIRTLLDAASALQYLHGRGLVHRALQPSALQLCSCAADPRGFVAKLTELGLSVGMAREGAPAAEAARAEEATAAADGEVPTGGPADAPARAASATASGAAAATAAAGRCSGACPPVGPLDCIPPEAFRGAPPSGPADVYAFGLMMWSCAHGGERPFAAQPPSQVPVLVLAGVRPAFRAHAPPAYRALAEACWCDDPLRRPSAAMLVERLTALLPISQ